MILISKYRSALMGLAILWIMFFHSKVFIPDGWFFFPLQFLKSSGYAGVEIFFLLSGLGLSFSLEKVDSLATFYKKRLTKIIPLYVLFSVLIYILKFHSTPFDLYHFLGKVTGLDLFYVGADSFFWFVPALLLFYAVTPVLYQAIKKSSLKYALLFTFSYLLILGLIIKFYPHNLIWYVRLPVFILGLYVGFLIYNKASNKYLDSLRLNVIFIMLCLLTLMFVLHFTDSEFRWKTGLGWYPTSMMAYPLAYCLSYLFENYIRAGVTGLSFIGAYTFELYLTHSLIYKVPSIISFEIYSFNVARLPEYMFYAGISLAVSIFIQKVMNRVT